MNEILKNKNIIKLLLWLIFIAILFIMFSVGSNQNNKIPEKNTYIFKHYDKMLEELEKNYVFNFNIKTSLNNYQLKGIKCNNNYVIYKEENGIISKINNFNDLNITDISSPKTIEDLLIYLKTNTYNISKNNELRVIDYNEKNISVTTDTKQIISIKINQIDEFYELNFTNVESCGNIM